MPANKRPRKLNYSVNKKGPVTGNKVAKAMTHYKKLQQRTKIEGETAWLKNAQEIVEKKLKKFGISPETI